MRVFAPAFILLLTGFGGFAAAVALGGNAVAAPAALGLGITLPLALATLIAAIRICSVRPEIGPLIIMGATFLRMIWAFGAVALLHSHTAEFGTTPTDLAQWTTGFYLLTLAVETLILWRILSNASRVKSPPGDGHTEAG